MPFLEHLEELRHVILSSLGALLVCATGGYFVSGRVLEYMVVHTVGQAQFLHPMEAFNVRFKLSLVLGVIVALPFIFFQIWSVIGPGLFLRERRLVLPMVFFSTVLLLGGMAFGYWVM